MARLPARAWEKECERFFAALKKFDDYLPSEKAAASPRRKIVFRPDRHALTHVGQIAMLRTDGWRSR